MYVVYAAFMVSVRRWIDASSPKVRSMLRPLKPSYRRRLKALEGLLPAEVFGQYFERSYWGADGESISGEGSTLAATDRLRGELPAVLHELGVSRLLDVPCGDHHWMAAVDLEGIDYVGGDIVMRLVEQTRARYGNTRRRFEVIDLIAGDLPPADALLTRDCLLHLNLDSIEKALKNVARSDLRWFLVSHYPDLRTNVDSPVGPSMPVSVTLPPFSLPAPMHQIPDGGPGTLRKTLAVWPVSALRSRLL